MTTRRDKDNKLMMLDTMSSSSGGGGFDGRRTTTTVNNANDQVALPLDVSEFSDRRNGGGGDDEGGGGCVDRFISCYDDADDNYIENGDNNNRRNVTPNQGTGHHHHHLNHLYHQQSSQQQQQQDQNTHQQQQQQQKKNNKIGKKKRRLCDLSLPLGLGIFTDVLIFLFVLIVCGVVEFGLIDGPIGGYYCKDPTLSHPYKGDTITNITLIMTTLLLPLIVIVGVELFNNWTLTMKENEKKSTPIPPSVTPSKSCRTPKKLNTMSLKRRWTRASKRDIWTWYRESILGSMFSLLLVEVAKLIVGEHRPHFLETCAPDTETTCQSGTFIYDYKCTNDAYSKRLLIDLSRSFPSGHSAISWYVGFYLAAFIHFRYDNNRVSSGGSTLLKPLMMTTCLLWGVICSLSRITDRRHHWHDVLAGSIFGIIFALYYVAYVTKRFNSGRYAIVSVEDDANNEEDYDYDYKGGCGGGGRDEDVEEGRTNQRKYVGGIGGDSDGRIVCGSYKIEEVDGRRII